MKCFSEILERWIAGREYAEVAPLLGAAFGTIHGWRHGRYLPPSTRIPAIAAAIGIPERKLRQVIAKEREARKHVTDGAADANGATETIPTAEVRP